MFIRKLFVTVAIAILQMALQAPAQLLHPTSPMPKFGAASVRPSKPSDELPTGGTNVDSYRLERRPIKDLIAYAFGLGYDQELVNVPSWVMHDSFDVLAKIDNDEVDAYRKLGRYEREAQMRWMAQSLLEERFHLKYHFETRTMPIYELQIAKDGFKCPRDTTSPPAIADTSKPTFRWSSAPAPPPPPPGWQPPSPQQQRANMQSLHLRTQGWPFWLLVTTLGHQPELNGRPLIDKTELDGSYLCNMVWSQEGSEGTNQPFFSATQDQLGLKLQPTKGPVEVLVIDSIDRPTEN